MSAFLVLKGWLVTFQWKILYQMVAVVVVDDSERM